jgi:hypothetical protein
MEQAAEKAQRELAQERTQVEAQALERVRRAAAEKARLEQERSSGPMSAELPSSFARSSAWMKITVIVCGIFIVALVVYWATRPKQKVLSAPVQLAPPNGSIFSSFPRTTVLVWQAVPGAASYTVEIDCFQCCERNAWCTDVGKSWSVRPGLTQTTYTFDWVGAQPGRWRVWTTAQDGRLGTQSGWFNFGYTQ